MYIPLARLFVAAETGPLAEATVGEKRGRRRWQVGGHGHLCVMWMWRFDGWSFVMKFAILIITYLELNDE